MRRNYLSAIYDKIGVDNRVELALWHEARNMKSACPVLGSLFAYLINCVTSFPMPIRPRTVSALGRYTIRREPSSSA